MPEIPPIVQNEFRAAWNVIAKDVHDTAVSKGWWDKDRNDGEMLCLMHSEISEALEAIRKGNPPDDKIPQHSGAAAELADVVIRIMDTCRSRGWDVAGALLDKIAFNKTRAYKHGGKAF